MTNGIGFSDGGDQRHSAPGELDAQTAADTPTPPDRVNIPADERPLVLEAFHTADLPPLPQRDRRLPASLWVEAPDALRRLGLDLGYDVVAYKRRIGRWLLWRAGPAVGAAARYAALDVEDLGRMFTFELDADGEGAGTGPDGVVHHRFRAWKESLRDT